MIAKERSASRATEITIFLIGLLMILGPSAVFYFNIQITERFFGAKDLLALSPIGEVVGPKKVVRRRGDEEPAFNPARSGDPVFVGDTIITGKDSSTRISLKDGSLIDVGPESMIRIEPVRSYSLKGIQKKLIVTVQTGTIKAKPKQGAAPIVVASSTGAVLNEVKVEKEKSILETLKEVSSTIGIKPETIEKVATTVAPIVAPVVLPEAKPTPTPTPAEEFVAVTAPPPITAQAEPLSQAAGKAQAPATFSLPTRDIRPEDLARIPMDEEEKVALNAPAPVAEKPLLSKITLLIEKPKDIEVIEKPKDGLISEEAQLHEQNFVFRWKDAGLRAVLPYTLWIDLDGRKTSLESPIPEAEWPIPYQAKGRITWWVEVPLKEGGTMQSKKHTSQWTLPGPTLASPDNGLDLPDFYVRGSGKEVLLTWKQMPICKGFELQVSRSPAFTELSFSGKTPNNYLSFPIPESGRFYWRTGCVYAETFTLFSAPRNFNVKLKN